jgi:hypothetical protein
VCDLETSRIGTPYIYDVSNLRVNTGIDHGKENIGKIEEIIFQ